MTLDCKNILDTSLEKRFLFSDLALILPIASGALVLLWLPLGQFAPLDAGPA